MIFKVLSIPNQPDSIRVVGVKGGDKTTEGTVGFLLNVVFASFTFESVFVLELLQSSRDTHPAHGQVCALWSAAPQLLLLCSVPGLFNS